METIFYVLFSNNKGEYSRMTYWNEKKSFKEYMEWQREQQDGVIKEHGDVSIENFDIKYNKLD